MTQDIAELPEVAQVPNKIRADTSNVDVQLFILNQLLKYDHNLNKPTAWDLVKNFTGDGEGIFALPQEQWMAAFGDRHGIMLYHKILQEKRHSEQDVITDVSNVTPFYNQDFNHRSKTPYGRILDTLGQFLRWRTPALPFSKASSFTNLRSQSPSPSQTQHMEPYAASSSSSSHQKSWGLREESPTFSRSSRESKGKKFSGGQEREMHGEASGLRSRSRKGRVSNC